MTDEERTALKRVTDTTVALIAAARAADEAVQALTRALEGMGDALPKPPPVDTSSICALLVALFAPDDLHRFSGFNTPDFTRRISWNHTLIEPIAIDFVGALERGGGLTADFFDALVAARPGREREIRKVQDEHNAAALEAFAEWTATDEAAEHAEELIARAAEGAAEMRKMHDVCRATLTTPMGPTLAPVDPTE